MRQPRIEAQPLLNVPSAREDACHVEATYDTRKKRCFSLTFKGRKKLDLAVTSDLRERAIGAVALQSCNRMSRRMMATPFFHIPIAP